MRGGDKGGRGEEVGRNCCGEATRQKSFGREERRDGVRDRNGDTIVEWGGVNNMVGL